MTLYITLFLAGMLTILLPCILPLVPVVLGVSIMGKSRLRPLLTVLGMVTSFVLFTFILLVLLNQFVELADLIRLGTYAVLFLFGIGFLTQSRVLRDLAGIAAGLFFLGKNVEVIVIASIAGVIVMEIASVVASRLQQVGLNVQQTARSGLGADAPLTAFIIGMTLGLVWVPCAGPALGFALTLVRTEPGPMALLALTAYAAGTAVPLLLVGYGGQIAVRSVRSLTRFTGAIKVVSGLFLLSTAVLLRLNAFQDLQVWLTEHTGFGALGTRLEQDLFPDPNRPTSSAGISSSASSRIMPLPKLPELIRAPEFTGLGPWHHSEPFTLASLKGKVVLVDFWTYSCINCIRTLPYVQGYHDKYKDTGKFVLLGVHSPEFTFEKLEKNVAMAIKEHGLTYPVAQDNAFGTWSAFANRYWPAKYLIDANGVIRYEHFGEGDYDETDRAIASLLQEAGVDLSTVGGTEIVAPERARAGALTPETYLGSRSWPAFGNAAGEPDTETHTYAIPKTMLQDRYYLGGSWKLVDDEAQQLVSDTGEVRMRFSGGEINLVMGLGEGAAPVTATVTVDGKPGTTFTIDRHDLYVLFKGEYGVHDIVLSLKGKGVEAFAFTFGS